MNTMPTSAEKPLRLRVVFQFLLLGFLLIAAPYASWHYLSKGVEYRQSRLAQMGQFGQVGTFPYLDSEGSTHTTEAWEGQVTLLGYPSSGQDQTILMEMLGRMKAQFAERSDVQVLAFREESAPISDPSTDIPWMVGQTDALKPLLAQVYDTTPQASGGVILLFDARRELRQWYVATDPDDMRRLAEHTAILLPPQRVSKPQLQRQVEK